MDNFIVSARKYRPSTFDMVVGQEVITGTLKNAIRNNYLSQAYLFCGPRGVGKTTCARIFAKTINCSNIGENSEPCNQCESCISFNTLRSLNIHELDAASNNKVEDIRTLTDLVRIPPQTGRYSIYIIDEVHMLSSSAFNAFLKTLEEPPPHAIFILATTEKHKIIPTILSRCQIFDFNRIKTDDTVKRLRFVAESEDVRYEEEALHIIAVKADGALRDALSIFDQLVSFSSGDIKYKDVIENLNLLDYEYYFKIVDASLRGDYPGSLILFNEILENGFDGHNFISGLASHLRDLLVSRDEVTIKLLETAPSIRARYREQAARCSVRFLFRSLEACNQCDLSYKASRNQRLLVELALFSMAALAESSNSTFTEEKKKSDEIVSEPDNEKKPVSVQALSPEKPVIENGSQPESMAMVKENLPEKPVETIVKPQDKVFHGTKTLSVKEVLGNSVMEPEVTTGVENREGEEPVPVPEVEELTQENLNKHWIEFTAAIRNESSRISIQLNETGPELAEDNHIIVTLSNAALREEFDRRFKISLTEFLNKRLGSGNITIESRLDSLEQNDTSFYTDEQKFEYLAGKNPALRELRRNLGLDFE